MKKTKKKVLKAPKRTVRARFVPDFSPIFSDKVLTAAPSKGQAHPKGQAQFVQGHAETSMLSTSELMIADILARNARPPEEDEDDELPKEKSVTPLKLGPQPYLPAPKAKGVFEPASADMVAKFTVKPTTHYAYNHKDACIKPVWQTSLAMLMFMKEYCGGSNKAWDLSVAIRKQLADGKRIGEISMELRECNAVVSTIADMDKLDPQLRPLLDLTSDNPDRITVSILKVLVKFPMTAQVDAWNLAKKPREPDKKKRTIGQMVNRLYELGALYFTRSRPAEPDPFKHLVGGVTHS
jgi:hypothetical protein